MKEKVIELVKNALLLDSNFDNEELEKSDLLAWGMDSVTAIQLIIMLESEFDIQFNDEDLMLTTVQSVDSIVSTVRKYMQNEVQEWE